MLGRLPRLVFQLSSSGSSFSTKTPPPSDSAFLKKLLSELEEMEQKVERLSLNDNIPHAPTSLQQDIATFHRAILRATDKSPVPGMRDVSEIELSDKFPENSNASTRRFPTSVTPLEYVPRSRNK